MLHVFDIVCSEFAMLESQKKLKFTRFEKKTYLPHGVIPSHVHCNETVESNNGYMMGSCDYINSINGHLNRN